MRGHRTRWTKAYESVAVLFVRAYTTLRGADELNYPFKNTKSTPLLVISGKEKWSCTKVTLWQLLHSVSTLSTWSVLLSGLCVFVYNVSLTLLLALLHLFGWNHLYHANSPFFPPMKTFWHISSDGQMVPTLWSLFLSVSWTVSVHFEGFYCWSSAVRTLAG